MYLVAAAILISIVLLARAANTWRLPLVVIALGAGILFGSDVSGIVYFDDVALAKRIGDAALVIVLFVGGFGTRKELLRRALAASLTLSTLGVVLTAAVTAAAVWLLLRCRPEHAVLLGCIISSTDAAAVFSILRTRALSQGLAAITEIESATNDPMAIMLTASAVQLIAAGHQHPAPVALAVLWQLAAGIGIGLLVGWAGCLLFERIKVVDRGYFYIFLTGMIALSYGAADAARGSGMLSAYFAGFVMGGSAIPYKKTLASFLEALGTIANAGMFAMLGLLVFPHEFGAIWKEGIILFAVVTFLARPLAVLVCTALARLSAREKVLLAWSGLRGAVPIILATYPVAAGIGESRNLFNIVFFAVGLSMLVQGTTIARVADWLKLAVKARPRPRQVMELVTLHTSDLELCEIDVDDALYEGETVVSALGLPAGATITMINRNDQIIAPQGSTRIAAGDVLYVLTRNADIEQVTAAILGKFKPRGGKDGVKRSAQATPERPDAPPPG